MADQGFTQKLFHVVLPCQSCASHSHSGEEAVCGLLIDTKLTYKAAEQVQSSNPGSIILRRIATK